MSLLGFMRLLSFIYCIFQCNQNISSIMSLEINLRLFVSLLNDYYCIIIFTGEQGGKINK